MLFMSYHVFFYRLIVHPPTHPPTYRAGKVVDRLHDFIGAHAQEGELAHLAGELLDSCLFCCCCCRCCCVFSRGAVLGGGQETLPGGHLLDWGEVLENGVGLFGSHLVAQGLDARGKEVQVGRPRAQRPAGKGGWMSRSLDEGQVCLPTHPPTISHTTYRSMAFSAPRPSNSCRALSPMASSTIRGMSTGT